MVLTYLDDWLLFTYLDEIIWAYVSSLVRDFFLTDEIDIENYLRIDVVKCKVGC